MHLQACSLLSRLGRARRTLATGCASSPSPHIRLSESVRDALQRGRPVVALESTIISHGMPFPQNLEMARGVETVVEDRGATPATIAVLGGVAHVGLDDAQLEHLARAGQNARKCSRRDLPAALADGADGATTVSGTMVLAHAAGVRVFATGGIGGVHRGAEDTMDVSADLLELGRTPVAVVSAGVKSILDIGRTLEVLETQGVPVMAYGTDEFPAFFSAKSGHAAPQRQDTPEGVAAVLHAAWGRLGLRNGALLAVPAPSNAGEEVEAAIQVALREAEASGVAGWGVTPFVLQRVNELTSGASLEANIELVRHNAAVAADVAIALAALDSSGGGGTADATGVTGDAGGGSGDGDGPAHVVVLGAVCQDIIQRPAAGTKLLRRTSNPGVVEQRWGGVGRNIAEGLARFGCSTRLVSVVGDDAIGAALVSDGGGVHAGAGCGDVARVPMDLSGVVRVPAGRTATYAALLDETGDLVAAVADMDVLLELTPDKLRQHWEGCESSRSMRHATIIITDANPPTETLLLLARCCEESDTPLWFEPTSVAKATRIVEAIECLTFMSPNVDELAAIAHCLTHAGSAGGAGSGQFPTDDVMEQMRVVLRAMYGSGANGAKHIVLTRGEAGVLVGSIGSLEDMVAASDANVASVQSGGAEPVGVVEVESESEGAGEGEGATRVAIAFREYSARPLAGDMVNCTGAGDSLVAGIVAGMLDGYSEGANGGAPGDGDHKRLQLTDNSVQLGLWAAQQSVQSDYAVSPTVRRASEIQL